MNYAYLPAEILVNIFEYLHLSDRICASQVCKQWYFATLDQRLWQKVAIVLHDNATSSMKILKNSHCVFNHLVLKEIDLTSNSLEFWESIGPTIQHLDFHSCDISERLFVDILSECMSLQYLGINGCNGLFISGILLERLSDLSLLETKLQNITELNLGCNRYLCDATFNRIMKLVPRLKKLSVAGCQISFHPGIYKRFYPKEEDKVPSGSVLTFQNILTFIKTMNKTLNSLNFGRTLIDSRALTILVKECGLSLKELYLVSCEQLSKFGIKALCEYQSQLKVLDLSMTYQIADESVSAICEKLLELQDLSLRRCHNLTDRSVSAISRLNKLKRLDLSSCEKITPFGFKEALCTESFLYLEHLNLSYCNITDDITLIFVKHMPNLLHLDLTSCFNITDLTVNAIAKYLLKLRTLRLAWCRDITDNSLANIKVTNETGEYDKNINCTSSNNLSTIDKLNQYSLIETEHSSLTSVKGLRELDICGCIKITDQTLKFGILFLELNYLNLSLCQNITDEGLISIGKNNPSLETFILSQCSKITDFGISNSIKYLPRIKYLDIQGCKLITDETLRNINKYALNIRYLDISHCDKMSLEEVEILEKDVKTLHTVHKLNIIYKQNEDKCDYLNF
ncbi:F-box/LRR-repeat protein 14-like [Centruroides sculpturatus]|uniref:F-box/LRR-repeat protein 14-like n=1 Tax=Centruroides sculpturatus TaxID=218467 RepID=UPI000C6DCA7E|nr:F-box/LRR-repeat protein 14-like [Centruroides sculpturatus]